MKNNLFKKIIKTLYPFAVLVIIWEIIFQCEVFPQYWFPGPFHVINIFFKMLFDGSLIKYSAISLLNTTLGFAAGAIFGIALGLYAGINKTFKDFVSPLISLVYPIPGIAWLPLVLLWFGFGYKAIIFTVGLSGFFSVFYNTLIGVENINIKYIRAGQSLGLRKFKLIKEVYFWGAFPFIFTGLKLGYGRSWRTVIAGEMLSFNIHGLGWFIWRSNEFFNFDQLLVGVISIGIIGLLVDKLVFKKIEEKKLKLWSEN
ncbi:MAG: ABC transporter permease [Nanoarchaeota archaeon]|nr:ABC transporter permease [Nanoarchaeota archaeon]